MLTLPHSALPSTPSSSVKRQVPADFDEVDTENIDPVQFFSVSNKKAKNFDFDSSRLTKAPLFALNLTPSNTPAKCAHLPQAAEQKRKVKDNASAHDTKRHEPSSAPIPTAAGRSPKHKRVGILSKRRNTASPFTRVDPPSFSAHKTGQPFSIAAALHGTVPSLKSKSKSKSSSKGWHFEIHEDTQDDEMANLMEHSTHTLDISDDEGRSSPIKGDCCNKENVAPVDHQTTANSPSRRDMMTEDVRSPLGDLETTEYYAEGCDASSVIIIPAEDDVEEANEKATMDGPFSPTRPRPYAAIEGQHGWESLLAQMGAKTDTTNEIAEDGTTEIQIWESESAKDEAEAIDDVNVAAGKQATSA